jgi:TPR repeat protein
MRSTSEDSGTSHACRNLRRTGLCLCLLLIAAHYEVASADEAKPKLREKAGAGTTEASNSLGGALKAQKEAEKNCPNAEDGAATDTPNGKKTAPSGLRAEDGDPSVGGRTRGTTCAVPDEEKPKLRGGEAQGDDAASKTANEKKAKAAREQAAAKAAAKAKEAAERAAALARPKNGSMVLVDIAEFIDEHAEVFLNEVKQALDGGEGCGSALKDSVLKFFGGQWVNSLMLCQVHEFSNGTIVKVPCTVQNHTAFVSRIYENATVDKDPQSQYWLGRMFETGCTIGENGVEVIGDDVNQAAQFYMDAGSQVPAANRALGQLLEAHGDENAASQLYSKALELGDIRSLALLGCLYEQHGSVEEALDLFTQGAAAKESLAMTMLALLLLDGKGIAADVPRAIDLLSQAAAQMECSAFYFLGHALEGGIGVKKNEKTASSFYEIAAGLGHAAAALALARMFNMGIGVAPDSEKAQLWAIKAAETGIQCATDDAYAELADQVKAEYASLPSQTPLIGGRPSRYEYIPITTYPLSKEEKAAQDALGFTGLELGPGDEIARYRHLEGSDYFKIPSVLWALENENENGVKKAKNRG